MKIKLNTTSAVAALSYIMPACKPKSPQPVYSNIMIEPVTETECRLTANNGEVQLTAKLDCQWEEQGRITVEGAKLSSIMKSLPKDSTATLKLDRDSLVVTCSRSRFKLKTIPAVEFPVFDQPDTAQEFIVDAAVMRKALDRVSPAMAVNDVRYYLNGVHLCFNSGKLDVVATDGHRLHMTTMQGDWGDHAVTLPNDAVRPVAALMTGGGVGLMLGENSLQASSGGRSVSVKLVDGKYPDYNRVIPRQNNNHVEFTRSELAGAVQRVKLLSNEKYKGMKFVVSGGECTLTGQNISNEESFETVPVVYSGPDIEAGFNADYVADVLSVVESDQVAFEFGEGMAGVVVNDGDLTAVVMQMRI